MHLRADAKVEPWGSLKFLKNYKTELNCWEKIENLSIPAQAARKLCLNVYRPIIYRPEF